MTDFLYRASLRARVEFKRLARRPFSSRLCPFRDDASSIRIVHSCYHKVGTVWFGRVLREIAAEFGLRHGAGTDYDSIVDFEQNGSSDVFIDNGSHVRLSSLPFPYRASHMIRDPRDLIVSAYFYHRWTTENWANMPRAELRGMTYRQFLNYVPKDEGIAAEIRRNSFWVPHMASWNYQNPAVFEIRYEDIIRDEEPVLLEMFSHYLFRPDAIDRCMGIARKYSFSTMKSKGAGGQKSHLRSGKTGEWSEHFTAAHKALFKELYPGALVTLGYELSDDW